MSSSLKLGYLGYKFFQKSGLHNFAFGRSIFQTAYFYYKEKLEDNYVYLTQVFPEIFSNGNILDIGANIGYTACLFSKNLSSDNFKVYAIEPDPTNYLMLKEIVKRKDLSKKIIASNYAVGESSGKVFLWINESSHADHRIVTNSFKNNSTDKKIEIEIISVDDLVASQEISKVSFLKIDVQGYEIPVLLGMKETLNNNPDISIGIEYAPKIMIELGFDPSPFLIFIEDNEFRAYSIEKKKIRPVSISELREIDTSSDDYIDILLTKKELTC